MTSLPFSLFTKKGEPIDKLSGQVSPTDILISVGQQAGPTAQRPTDEKERQYQAHLAGLWMNAKPLPGDKTGTVLAVPHQKILVIRTDGNSPLLDKKRERVLLNFSPATGGAAINLPVRVVRTCETPNQLAEFGVPTVTVLVEWSDTFPDFGSFTFNGAGGVMGGAAQTDNIVIIGKPNGDPGPPILATLPKQVVPPTDFIPTDDVADQAFYSTDSELDKPIVALIDTGLTFKFVDAASGVTSYTYPARNGSTARFSVAIVPGSSLGNAELTKNWLGYNALTDYQLACPDSGPANAHYRSMPEYAGLATLTQKAVLNSPYDDNRAFDLDAAGNQTNKKRGRHGSTIASIINQKGNVRVLPVKAFNAGGFGTLFDLLCSFSYVLACKQAGVAIQVVNASFAGQLLQDGFDLLHRKLKILSEWQIWVVAAAGNDILPLSSKPNPTPADLGTNAALNLYPACFSEEFDNVITVTAVKPVYLYELVGGKGVKSKSVAGISATERRQIMEQLKLADTDYQWKGVKGYSVVGNYSPSLVNVGVTMPFLSLFAHGETEFTGTSFAAGYFSAKLANYLHNYGGASISRDTLLQKLCTAGNGPGLAGRIEKERLMKPI